MTSSDWVIKGHKCVMEASLSGWAGLEAAMVAASAIRGWRIAIEKSRRQLQACWWCCRWRRDAVRVNLHDRRIHTLLGSPIY